MIGFLNINKPAGLTSHDVVGRIRRLAGRKTRVGHAGTLDPAATGVLPVALGGATRLIEYLTDTKKGYRATVALGITTTTDDAAGEPIEQQPVPPLDRAALEAVLPAFRGPLLQVPPMYSALHHQGKRLYELARAGQTVERPPRAVTIERLELVPTAALPLEPPISHFVLAVVCSKGTYIRALARDIGAALGCGAHLAALERTAVGGFHIQQAIPLDTLHTADDIARSLLPPEIAIATWPQVILTTDQSRAVRNGQPLQLAALAESAATQARAHGPDGQLIALLRHSTEQPALWRPEKVLG